MRTTVIPAQITTVEDKIAGNLNLTQIVLLLASLFMATFIYAVFPPRLAFSVYKIPLFLVTFIIFGTLALRIKGKVVLNWLFILAEYFLRPQYYIFNKNDLTTRDIQYVLKPARAKVFHAKAVKEKEAKSSRLSIAEMVRLETMLANPKNSFTLRFKK